MGTKHPKVSYSVPARHLCWKRKGFERPMRLLLFKPAIANGTGRSRNTPGGLHEESVGFGNCLSGLALIEMSSDRIEALISDLNSECDNSPQSRRDSKCCRS